MRVGPLIFEPIYRAKVWGGRRLSDWLDKRLPPDVAIGESWELSDLPGAESVAARGPVAGKSLHELVSEWGSDLMGRAKLLDGRFPLLIKFLDATAPLSIQVHPDEATLREHGLHGPAKHEAWYVIHAEPGAVIYRGLAAGVTREDLSRCLASAPERMIELLREEPVKAGDAFYLPGGTVHALGGGIVVAEVQTPSDVTYRLFDWGRTRPDGDAGLHVEAALKSVRTGMDFAPHEKRSHVTSIFTTVTRLIDCPSFRLEKVRFVEGVEQDIPYAEPVCWIVLEGAGEIHDGSGGHERFSRGEVVLLPAGLKSPRLKTLTRCTWLEVTLPAVSDLAEFDRPDRSAIHPGDKALSTVPLNLTIRRDSSPTEGRG